ncbi:MAG: hypothetical protein Q4E77_01380 [Conchiformibius sp.]|nr:hypothetical protein [Conchiformibius sp.]
MKYSVLWTVGAAACLSACGDDAPTPVTPPLTAASGSAVVTNFASAAASSPIATEILNSSQEQDILSSSRQAMAAVSASEVEAFEKEVQAEVLEHHAASSPNIPPMNAVCTQYFQRVERCFTQVGAEEGEALLGMTRDAQAELAAEQPDEESCSALNRSFNAVARNMGCE